MRILLIGSGGREHAMAWKLSISTLVQDVFVFPGNPGIFSLEKIRHLPESYVHANWNGLAQWAKTQNIDLLVVGPEQALSEGIVDHFQHEGIACFGPTQKAARLESSKVYCKSVLQSAHIPTAKSAVCENISQAQEALKHFDFPLVLKADGLAAGKGVVICHSNSEAQETLMNMFVHKKFGEASAQILIEEFLEGPEVSYMVVASGTDFIELATAQDHKRLLNHDLGPNTGGMGAYSPTKLVSAELNEVIRSTVIQPTLNYLKNHKTHFVGILYAGLILTKEGPKVLEYNVRMGDPETQVILRRLNTDFATLCLDAALGNKLPKSLSWDERVSLGVVLASHGYPDSPRKHDSITGLEKLCDPILAFHSGTALSKNELKTSGGRVLTVTSLAKDFNTARELAYQAVSEVTFEGMQYRTDIGYQAL